MATSKRVKKQAKKKAKTGNMQRVEEYVSCLQELHKLQGVLLKKLDNSIPEKA